MFRSLTIIVQQEVGTQEWRIVLERLAGDWNAIVYGAGEVEPYANATASRAEEAESMAFRVIQRAI